MKKNKVSFITDKFVDENGNEHPFIICAISQEIEDASIFHGDVMLGHFDGISIVKALSLGYAICNSAEDVFNDKIGRNIAEGRALKYVDKVLFTTASGLINSTSVEAILKQEAEFLKNNPELYIKGLNKKRKND